MLHKHASSRLWLDLLCETFFTIIQSSSCLLNSTNTLSLTILTPMLSVLSRSRWSQLAAAQTPKLVFTFGLEFVWYVLYYLHYNILIPLWLVDFVNLFLLFLHHLWSKGCPHHVVSNCCNSASYSQLHLSSLCFKDWWSKAHQVLCLLLDRHQCHWIHPDHCRISQGTNCTNCLYRDQCKLTNYDVHYNETTALDDYSIDYSHSNVQLAPFLDQAQCFPWRDWTSVCVIAL